MSVIDINRKLKKESVSVMRDFQLKFPSVMEINSSGSSILYLYLDINSPQKKSLSVIILDTTVLYEARENAKSQIAPVLSPTWAYSGCSRECSRGCLMLRRDQDQMKQGSKNYCACSPEEFCEYFLCVCLGILH